MNPSQTFRIEGRHVLAGFIGFFSVMLVANAFFVYFAISTFGGIDTADAYRKGLDYNATLEDATRQAALGWQTSLHFDEASQALKLEISDRAGNAITGLTVEGRLMRPATSQFDRALGSFEERGGVYVLPGVDLDDGAWIADLSAQSPAYPTYHLRERLWLPPRS